MSRVRSAAVAAMVWMTIQGFILGVTIGVALAGHHISPLIFVAQCALFALVARNNYSAIVKAGSDE